MQRRRPWAWLLLAAVCQCLTAVPAATEASRPWLGGISDSSNSSGRALPLVGEQEAFMQLGQQEHGLDVGGQVTNVSGSYRGTWEQSAMPEEAAIAASVLRHPKGVVTLTLNANSSSHSGVHHVEGEVLLRDGPYITEQAMALKLTGVYVPASGRLHALLESPQPLRLPFSPQDQDPAAADYRQALRRAVQQLAAAPAREDSSLQSAVGLSRQKLLAHLQRQCKFSLNLGTSGPPLRPADVTAAAAVAAAKGAQAAALVAKNGRQPAGGSRRAADDSDRPGSDGDALVNLNGTLAAANCGIALRITASKSHLEQYYAKAINYTLMITGISFIQVLLLIRQIEATATQALASRVSLVTIGQQAVMDAYLCLLHLTTGIMVEPLFNAFATAAFFEFVIFAIFETRWLLMAWRARRGGSEDAWQQQRELSLLYARFYGALLTGIMLSYQLQRYMKYVLFALYSWWLPQIVQSAVDDSRQPLKPFYVVGTSAARLALPLYLFACPANLLRIQPSYGAAALLVASVAAQAALLISQHHYGPRCFVPRALLPPRYDYHRAVPASLLPGGAGGACRHGGNNADASSAPDSPRDEETGHGSLECVICMNPVDLKKLKARMVTPCGHFFHPKCLARWMDVKMECPTCRFRLPPI